jgi:hypothetical protein
MDRILELARGVDGDTRSLDMTALSLRLSNAANAVSKLHSVTANNTWQGLGDKQIQAVTNGVHMPTWVGQPLRYLFERHLGAELDNVDARNGQRRLLGAHGPDPGHGSVGSASAPEAGTDDLRPQPAAPPVRPPRRVARHPRGARGRAGRRHADDRLRPTLRDLQASQPALLDMDRISRLLWDKDRPVQIIFAGKAHPADRPGQGVIQEIFARSRSPQLRGRVFILEDYDMRVARFMVQGVDVWLNNPRRPLEASGTSGMKASATASQPLRPGRLVGRGLARRQRLGDRRARDQPGRGRAGLQRRSGPLPLLEQEVVPLYYGRNEDDVPEGWTAEMRRSIASTIWRFSTIRMLHEYVEKMYLPAAGVAVKKQAGRRAAPTRAEAGLSGRVSLALVIHNHQPVGNFGWVIQDVYEHAYSPMLGALERHPGIRLGLHYSGPLLSGWRPTGPRRWTRSAASWTAARWRSWAAASTNRSSSRCRTATATASWSGCATSWRLCSGSGRRRVAGGTRLGAVARLRPRRGRLRVDRPGRQPPPRRLDPRRRDVDGRSPPTTAASG